LFVCFLSCFDDAEIMFLSMSSMRFNAMNDSVMWFECAFSYWIMC